MVSVRFHKILTIDIPCREVGYSAQTIKLIKKYSPGAVANDARAKYHADKG